MRTTKIVCLCGSSRWPGLHLKVTMKETIEEGSIVINMGCYGHADFPPGAKNLTSDGDLADITKRQLDELHLKKIDLSDEMRTSRSRIRGLLLVRRFSSYYLWLAGKLWPIS